MEPSPQGVSWRHVRNSLLVALISLPASLAVSCAKKSPCICTTTDSFIDLTPLGNSDGTPRFPNLMSADGQFYYAWNPCYPFTEKLCSDVAGCQVRADGTNSFSIGRQDTAQFVDVNDVITLQYTDTTDAHRASFVRLECSRLEAEVSFDGEKPPDSGNYFFTLRSKHACLGSVPDDAPSLWHISLMIFLILVTVYAILSGMLQAVMRRLMEWLRACCKVLARTVGSV